MNAPEIRTTSGERVTVNPYRVHEQPAQWVILAGNVIDGLRLIGPFASANYAGDHAIEELRGEDWTVARIEAPEGGDAA